MKLSRIVVFFIVSILIIFTLIPDPIAFALYASDDLDDLEDLYEEIDEEEADDVDDISTVVREVPELPNITARIAVVMDYHTGEVLYERNMDQRWIPASMTKSMTAFITYQEIEAGNLTLETEIRVSESAARFSTNRRVPGSNVPLPAGVYVSVDVLLQLTMLPSGNAAAYLLAEYISGDQETFVARMNETAASLGMFAEFTNSHGAFIHHTDAYSMAVLVREFISQYPDILRITAMPRMNFRGRNFNNTNQLVRSNPFLGADGFKTGTLRQSGPNHSTTAYRDGRRIIVVVMNAPDRHRDSRRLLEYGFAVLEHRDAELAARVRVFYNGSLLPLDTTPIISHGNIMLPAELMFDGQSYTTVWYEEYGLINLHAETGDMITIFLGRNIFVINGETYMTEVAAVVADYQIYVPPEIVAVVTGTEVTVNISHGVVQFQSNGHISP